jgi:hypothetical protein
MTRIHANPKSLTWAHERACLPGRQAGLDRLALPSLPELETALR